VQRDPVTVANFSNFFYQKSNSSGDIEFTRAFLNNVNWFPNKAKLITHPFHELSGLGIKISTSSKYISARANCLRAVDFSISLASSPPRDCIWYINT
jgi:hypothetical protein